ncbi:MAG: hypothetical protein FWD01_05700 [Defluviitaleaceae bacterium]|nr:hypothetical protein [Defluviitaleaceae bacterium]
MKENLIGLLMPHNKISLIGMAKNAGKTTVLNYLINEFDRRGISLCLTSIGRDGEDLDIVTKTKKPRIYIPSDTIVITAENLLKLCDTTIEILAVTNINTSMGRVIIFKSLSAGFVQLGGASIISQMTELVAEFGDCSRKVIIDGAISRKSLANPNLANAVVLCTGAGLSRNMDDVVSQTAHAACMLGLPAAPKNAVNPFFLHGAISDARIKEILLSKEDLKDRYIIADDATKIFINPNTYEKLLIKRAVLAVKTPINLVAITVNPVSPYGINFPAKEFLEKMQSKVKIPVFDVVVS